jgi:hypothetical protein
MHFIFVKSGMAEVFRVRREQKPERPQTVWLRKSKSQSMKGNLTLQPLRAVGIVLLSSLPTGNAI